LPSAPFCQISEDGQDAGFACVECRSSVASVYREFSAGCIRLTKCESCSQFADPYVEYDTMLIVLDLILHKSQVYRHLLFNRHKLNNGALGPTLLKLLPIYLFLDTYLKWFFLKSSRKHSDTQYALDYDHYLMFLCACENFAYVAAILCLVKTWIKPSANDFRRFVDALLLSSFGKMFVLVMMIWDYDINFGRGIDIFVMTSNVTACKVALGESNSVRPGLMVAFGALCRFVLVGPLLSFLFNYHLVLVGDLWN